MEERSQKIFIDKLQVFSYYTKFYKLTRQVLCTFFYNKFTTILHLQNSATLSLSVTLNNVELLRIFLNTLLFNYFYGGPQVKRQTQIEQGKSKLQNGKSKLYKTKAN